MSKFESYRVNLQEHFLRFTGALGLAMSMFRDGHAPQSPTEAAQELHLGGVAASEVIQGLEASLEEAAAEHDPFRVIRSDEKVL